jgi:hypothetical protein
MPEAGLVIGIPAPDSVLLEIVTLFPPETETPYDPVAEKVFPVMLTPALLEMLIPADDVPLTVKPLMTTLLRLEIENALAPPLIVTPGFAWNVTPEFFGLTLVPWYVPAWTSTVSPATATFAAPAIVQKGFAGVPGPDAEQLADVLSTMYTVPEALATPVSAEATSTPAAKPATPNHLRRIPRCLAIRPTGALAGGIAQPSAAGPQPTRAEQPGPSASAMRSTSDRTCEVNRSPGFGGLCKPVVAAQPE